MHVWLFDAAGQSPTGPGMSSSKDTRTRADGSHAGQKGNCKLSAFDVDTNDAGRVRAIVLEYRHRRVVTPRHRRCACPDLSQGGKRSESLEQWGSTTQQLG